MNNTFELDLLDIAAAFDVQPEPKRLIGGHRVRSLTEGYRFSGDWGNVVFGQWSHLFVFRLHPGHHFVLHIGTTINKGAADWTHMDIKIDRDKSGTDWEKRRLQMVSALYVLGFTTELLTEQWGVDLSAHEKIEAIFNFRERRQKLPLEPRLKKWMGVHSG